MPLCYCMNLFKIYPYCMFGVLHYIREAIKHFVGNTSPFTPSCGLCMLVTIPILAYIMKYEWWWTYKLKLIVYIWLCQNPPCELNQLEWFLDLPMHYIRGCTLMTSCNFGPFWTPPSPLSYYVTFWLTPPPPTPMMTSFMYNIYFWEDKKYKIGDIY